MKKFSPKPLYLIALVMLVGCEIVSVLLQANVLTTGAEEVVERKAASIGERNGAREVAQETEAQAVTHSAHAPAVHHGELHVNKPNDVPLETDIAKSTEQEEAERALQAVEDERLEKALQAEEDAKKVRDQAQNKLQKAGRQLSDTQTERDVVKKTKRGAARASDRRRAVNKVIAQKKVVTDAENELSRAQNNFNRVSKARSDVQSSIAARRSGSPIVHTENIKPESTAIKTMHEPVAEDEDEVVNEEATTGMSSRKKAIITTGVVVLGVTGVAAYEGSSKSGDQPATKKPEPKKTNTNNRYSK